MKPINTSAELFIVKAGGTYSYHWAELLLLYATCRRIILDLT
jgi:hypothetical protein